MTTSALTIGRLARAADVGIETIRYYQRLGLLPLPRAEAGSAFRKYPAELIDRIRFIKRAQELGFTLGEIATLLELEDGADRRAIRKVAAARLSEIRNRMSDLQRMEKVLSHLIAHCAATGTAHPCPIIGALLDGSKRTRPSEANAVKRRR